MFNVKVNLVYVKYVALEFILLFGTKSLPNLIPFATLNHVLCRLRYFVSFSVSNDNLSSKIIVILFCTVIFTFFKVLKASLAVGLITYNQWIASNDPFLPTPPPPRRAPLRNHYTTSEQQLKTTLSYCFSLPLKGYFNLILLGFTCA